MGKFKKGDKVEVRNYPAKHWLGCGVVDEADYGSIVVNFDDGRRGGFDEEFVFPSDSPVRTVTRREIVPGAYGAVSVDDDFARTVVWLYDDEAVASLRSAARIFNEIADVIEEQSAEAKESA